MSELVIWLVRARTDSASRRRPGLRPTTGAEMHVPFRASLVASIESMEFLESSKYDLFGFVCFRASPSAQNHLKWCRRVIWARDQKHVCTRGPKTPPVRVRT
jgi:hypothetical protein